MKESQILKHVEQLEFLKEIARREVATLIRKMDLETLLVENDSAVDEIIAGLLVILADRVTSFANEARTHSTRLGLDALSDDDLAAVVDEVSDTFILTASASLIAALAPVRETLRQMLDSGVSQAALRTSLSSAATREAVLSRFESTARTVAASVFQDLDRTVTDSAVELTAATWTATETDSVPIFEWLAIMDDATCDDLIENSCAPRHNVLLTIDEWDELGRPGSPQLICSIYAKGASYCRCLLQLSGKTGDSKILNPVKVTDAIRTGRERAAVLA